MHSDLSKILVATHAIQSRIGALGLEIAQTYRATGVEEITIVAVTNGAVVFTADLMRAIPDMQVRLDTVRISSYRDDDHPLTEPEVLTPLRLDVRGAHVLLVDDILDTGKTLQAVARILRARQPASLKTCVLLDKRARRAVAFEADFRGFEIPDHFVVGYGLDFAEHYRNLPYIGVLKPELQHQPA